MIAHDRESSHIIDADQLVKNIYKNKESLQFIKKEFPECTNEDGIIFAKLREVFFKDTKKQKLIEKYIYQKLPEEFHKEFLKLKGDYIFYDVPLLFEKKLDQYIDMTVCVYASKDEQIKRLIKRDSISKELAEEIISKQLSIEEKKKKSDYIIDNSENKKNLNEKMASFIQAINNLINK